MFLRDPAMEASARQDSSPPSTSNPPHDSSVADESAWLRRQRTVLHDLGQLVANRAQAEPQVEEQFQSGTQAAEEEFEVTFQDVVVRFAAEKEAADREFEEARQARTAR